MHKEQGAQQAPECKAPQALPAETVPSLAAHTPLEAAAAANRNQSGVTLNDLMIKRKYNDTTGKPATSDQNRIDTNRRRLLQTIHTNNLNSICNNSGGTSGDTHNHGGTRAHSGTSSNQSNYIGNYELIKTLGRGNFATVKLAKHKITNHSVAIKIVKLSNLTEDNLMKVNREIEIMKKLGRHKHIVRLYQVIKTKRYYFLVTDCCANGELYDYIVEKGKLSEQQSCKYFMQVISAIEYLHDHNVVHRDLKAENLLLTDNFETIKIADFGFANYFKQDDLLSTWCGSPPYAAPELFKGVRYIGPQVDIWSMGVVLYVLVCGSLPFDGHNLVFLKSRVLSGKFRVPFFMSSQCESLIRGMLRLDPEKRFGIKQIRSHIWMQKYSNLNSIEATKVSNKSSLDSNNNNTDKTATLSSNSTMDLDKDKSSNRGQSLDLEDEKKVDTIIQSEDASMLSLTGCVEPNIKRLGQNASSKLNPTDIRNLVDTDIANAVSNMSIDSNNSSMSQGIGMVNMGADGRSGHNSSLSSSRYSNPRADSSCGSSVRQFSKESSIDDQIIDFMVENLKVAEHQNSIRQSIANGKYDDLHAIYRLLKDQPDMVLSAKFKIPSLPLISPSKDDCARKPSITTGFFDFAQVNKPIQPVRADGFSFSNDNNTGLAYRKTSEGDTNVMNLTKNSLKDDIKEQQNVNRQRGSEDLSWTKPPQLFLTPPIEGRSQQRGDEIVDTTDPIGQDGLVYTRHCIARHSFDSTIKNSRTIEMNSTLNQIRDTRWDSSTLDPQLSTINPSTPAGLGESSISNSFSDTHNTSQVEDPLQLARKLASITTDLPKIGVQAGANAPDHNMLLAQLNSTGCNLVMTQSGLLTQNDPTEQRLQQTVPLKFTPNNLVNQNYSVLNNMALQNTLKIPGMQNLSLLDPDCLLSGLERRASDGQASYSSLTTTSNERVIVNQQGTNIIQPAKMESTSFGKPSVSCSSNQLSSQNQGAYQYGTDVISSQFGNHLSNTQFRCSPNAAVLTGPSSGQTPQEESVIQKSGANDTGGPLDLSNKSPHSNIKYANFAVFRQDNASKVNNQRSNSTTSETLGYFPALSPSSATTSPRNSIFSPNPALGQSSTTFYRASPSSSSLTGGGPGHLLHRRKRHSLDTESRHLNSHQHHHNHHHPHHYNQQNSVYPAQYSHLNFTTNNQLRHVHKMLNSDASRSPRHTSYNQNYATTNPFGPLRNFSQTPMKQTTSSSSSGWGTPKSPATSTTVDMDTSESQDAGLSSDEKFFVESQN